jgi:hypothetical protein
MDTQLIHEVILKFETSQLQFQQNNQDPAKSIYAPESGRINIKQESDFLQKSENSPRKDKAGRSLLGQQYIWALVNWLAGYPELNMMGHFNNEIYRNVSGWLGIKSPEKEKLVRIIVAKLTHDWKSLKKFNQGSANKVLAYFASSMDIWQYTFPKMLDKLLQDIGKMEFKICDLCEKTDIEKDDKTNIENEFAILCNLMNSGIVSNSNGFPVENNLIKIWLIASITKTLKDQTGLTGLFSGLDQNT